MNYDDLLKLCRTEKPEVVNAILEANNYIWHNWNYILESGCRGGNKPMIDYAISKGAYYWNGGMHRASVGGHLDIVHSMIEKGADNWSFCLAATVQYGHYDIAKLMIEKGGNVNDRNVRPFLSGESHIRVKTLLVLHGADIENVRLHDEVIECLVKCGHKISGVNEDKANTFIETQKYIISLLNNFVLTDISCIISCY